MNSRFVKWCLLILAWIVILNGCFFLLDFMGLSSWKGFLALIPVLLLVRYTVQRFWSKDQREPSE